MSRFGVTGLRLKGNIYWVLVQRLLIVMMLFTLCRVGFYVFNNNYFPELTISRFLKIGWGGLKFDFSAILYINSLFILLHAIPLNFRFNNHFQSFMKYLFFITNGAALAMNVSDFIYYKFTLRRTTSDVFQQFENESNLVALFFQFVFDYWYAVLFWFALLWLMVWLYKKTKITGRMIRNPFAYYGFGVLGFPLVIFFFIAGARGGIAAGSRPITLSNAGEYVKEPQEVNIVLNTPFAIFRTLGKTKIQRLKYYDDGELESIYTPVHTISDSIPFQADNVVVFILESFSREFFGVFNQDKPGYSGYTPFLDSLVQHSKTFKYSFANGRKSIDGLPSVVASIPSLGVPYILTPFSGNAINSVGSLLGKKGYHTSFFHGAPNGSMGFNSFTNLAGFEHYYGKDEFDRQDREGMWGIWDDTFFDFYADKLNEFPQPFASGLFSLSSHHPFTIPKEFEGIFKGGEQPILKCIQYTDYSLKKFFEKVSKMPWYKNTLFVFTADHCSANIIFDETRTTWGFYAVPVIFFKPDNSLAGTEQEIIQQIDILPSIMGYLHYDEPYVAFGRDAFRESARPFAVNYSDTYNFYQDDYLLMFDGVKTVGLFNFKADKMLTLDLKDQLPDTVASMEMNLKAILQQYNNRMIDNRLRPN